MPTCGELINLIVLISSQDRDLFFSIFLRKFKVVNELKAKRLSYYKDFKVKLTQPTKGKLKQNSLNNLNSTTEILHNTHSFRR